MALPILDGNQSATTLSSILTGGEHIPAHTVVSLGTQAITDISGAVSGSVVSISNFPATQTIAGTVTANLAPQANGPIIEIDSPIPSDPKYATIVGGFDTGSGESRALRLGSTGAIIVQELPAISGTVTIGSALPAGTNRIGVVTIGNIQRDGDGVQTSLLTEVGSGYLLNRSFLGAGTAQIGSVTASVTNPVTVGAIVGPNGGSVFKGASGSADAIRALPYFSQNGAVNYNELSTSNPFPIAGSVTIGAGTAQIGSVTASISNSVTIGSLPAISGTVTVGNSVTIGSLPAIAGTVTATIRNGEDAIYNESVGSGYTVIRAQSHWYDDVVDNEIKNTSQTNPLPISGTVTVGNSVTIGSLPLIAGTVTVSNAVELAQALLDQSSSYASLDVNIGGVGSVTLPISGTVTIGAGTAQIGSVTASISNSVTIASFATSVTARLINPAGTAVTYAEVGTAGSPSIDVLSVQGVTSGTAIPISISSVTIGSLPAISGTVTANLAISSTVITSGSFTSLTSATLVPANPARKMATVFNLGAGQLFINAGVTATTLGGGFMVALSSGDFYECDYTTTTLSAIFATAGTASWMSH